MSKPLGDILIDAELISKKTLEKALERQRESGKLLGQVLEEMGVLTEAELMEALVRQHSPFAEVDQKKQLGDGADPHPLYRRSARAATQGNGVLIACC